MKYIKKFNEAVNADNNQEVLESILENIESILVELKDNDIPVNIDVKDKRVNFLTIDINFSNNPLIDRYKVFDVDKFFDNKANSGLKPYIKDCLTMLQDYLNEIGMSIYTYQSYKSGGGHETLDSFLTTSRAYINYKGLRDIRLVINKKK